MTRHLPHNDSAVEIRRAIQGLERNFFDESSDVDHDATTNFVANEHINHSAVSISTGTGLSGGGTIAANRTISLSHLGVEALIDPDADRILFWDDSATALKWLTVGANLTITDTTIAATGGVTDHGGLTGLSDDDHTHYFLADGTREITGNVTLNPDGRRMLFGSSDITAELGRFALQSLTAGATMFLDLYANDGDSTDMVGLAVWAKGLPGAYANTEILQFYWDPGNTEFTLNVYAGGTGTSRQLAFYTNGNRGQLLLATDGAVHIGDDLYIAPGGNTFLFRDGMVGAGGLGRFAIQAQSAGTDTFIDIHSHDGDTTDYVGLAIWGRGLPNSFANIELYQSYWDPVNSEYATTVYIAGSGTTRPINFYTSGNRGQLLLQTSGAISMSGALAVTGNITGPNVSSGADPGHTHTSTSLPDVESLSTSLTAGSVVFSNGSNLAQDNAKLFWDDGNDRLGMGMTAPALTLQVHFAGTGRVVGFYATDADSVGEESLIHIGGNQATAHYGVMIGGTPEVSSPSVQDWAFIIKTNPGTGVAHTERVRVSSNGHMGINETDPKDYLHVSKTASTGAPGIRITDTTAQAINVGGGIGFWGKYTDAGATAMAALIRVNKINSTTGNNGFALKFYIRYPGSTGVQEVATFAGDGQNGQLAIANAPQAANVVANAVGMLCTGQYYGTGRVTGTVSGFNATGRIRTGAAAGTTTQLRAGNYAIQNDDADTIVTNAKGLSIATPGNAGTFTNTYGLQIQSQTVGTQTNTPYGIYQEGGGDFNYFAGKVGIAGSSPTAFLDVNSDIIRLRTAKTPATSGAAGNQGDICWDASYIYVCTATNTWERAAIAVW